MLLKVNRSGTCPQLRTCGELEGSEAWRRSDRRLRIWRHSGTVVEHPLHCCEQLTPDNFSALVKEAFSSGYNTSICVRTTSLLADEEDIMDGKPRGFFSASLEATCHIENFCLTSSGLLVGHDLLGMDHDHGRIHVRALHVCKKLDFSTKFTYSSFVIFFHSISEFRLLQILMKNKIKSFHQKTPGNFVTYKWRLKILQIERNLWTGLITSWPAYSLLSWNSVKHTICGFGSGFMTQLLA